MGRSVYMTLSLHLQTIYSQTVVDNMLPYLISFCLIGLIAVNSENANIKESSNVTVSGPDSFIVFGRPARQGEFPWMASLHVGGRFSCSSFIISPSFIATAAHCVVRGRRVLRPDDMKAIVGNVFRDGPRNTVFFSQVISHEQYGVQNAHDIALLKTSKPLEVNDNIKPICISAPDKVFAGTWARSMGWGRTHTRLPSSTVLLTTPMLVTQPAYCERVYSTFRIGVNDQHICAGGHISGVCYGDSGSPLITTVNSTPVAIGVTSFGTYLGCAFLAIPEVFTSISRHTDWILEKAGSSSSEICVAE